MPRNDVKFVEMPMLKTLLLNRPMSSIGDGERISHQTKADRKQTNPSAAARIGGEVHPMREPLDTPNRKVRSTAVERAAPVKSYLRSRLSCRKASLLISKQYRRHCAKSPSGR